MLVIITLDANNHLYPMAFAVVDSESNNVWMYSMLKLREAIRDVENLVFVSDWHRNIAYVLSIVFPEAHHGACIYHIKMKINHKFKIDHCDVEFELAAYTYHAFKFGHHYEKIKVKNPCITAYLEEIGVEK